VRRSKEACDGRNIDAGDGKFAWRKTPSRSGSRRGWTRTAQLARDEHAAQSQRAPPYRVHESASPPPRAAGRRGALCRSANSAASHQNRLGAGTGARREGRRRPRACRPGRSSPPPMNRSARPQAPTLTPCWGGRCLVAGLGCVCVPPCF
jgi:hypothetical protein